MKAQHFILGNDKVTLWRNHVAELKDQISEILRLMTSGGEGSDEEEQKKNSGVNLWRSRRHDVFRAAREQKLPVYLSCRTLNAASGAEKECRLTARVLQETPLTLSLLDAPPTLDTIADYCSYTFTVKDEDTRLEVSGTAAVREVQRRVDEARLVVSLTRRPVVRPVIDPPALLDCTCPSSTRLVLAPTLPRTLQALKALLRQSEEKEEDAPRLHTISPTGATFRLSPEIAAQWLRTFERFLVIFIPHFGIHQDIFIFQAQKTALQRQEDGGSLILLKFERSLRLDDNNRLQWIPLDRKGSKRIYRLAREMAGSLPSQTDKK